MLGALLILGFAIGVSLFFDYHDTLEVKRSRNNHN